MKSNTSSLFIFLCIFSPAISYGDQLRLPNGKTVDRSALPIVSYTSDVTPLHQAALEGRVDEAKRLVARGGDIEAKTNDGTTPIHSASVAGHPEVVEFLISKHAKVDATDNEGRTPLHSAAMHGHVSVAKLLIAAGADVNRRIQLGKTAFTPLGLASLLGQQEMEVFLAAHGGRE
ncbi:MAG: ankyrin repeat domain-containing protein [Patescibacteria group bacterium]